MSILDRLNMLVRSEYGAITRRGNDDARATLRDAADAVAALRRADQQLANAEQRTLDAIASLEQRAIQAVRRGDDQEAHRLLAQKSRLESEARNIEHQRERTSGELGQMRGALQALRARTNNAGAIPPGPPPAAAPPARPLPAPSTPSSPEYDYPLPGQSQAFERFSELEDQLHSLEAQLDADAYVDSAYIDPLIDPAQVRLERELQTLESQKVVAEARSADDALSRLRAAMNSKDDDD